MPEQAFPWGFFLAEYVLPFRVKREKQQGNRGRIISDTALYH